MNLNFSLQFLTALNEIITISKKNSTQYSANLENLIQMRQELLATTSINNNYYLPIEQVSFLLKFDKLKELLTTQFETKENQLIFLQWFPYELSLSNDLKVQNDTIILFLQKLPIQQIEKEPVLNTLSATLQAPDLALPKLNSVSSTQMDTPFVPPFVSTDLKSEQNDINDVPNNSSTTVEVQNPKLQSFLVSKKNLASKGGVSIMQNRLNLAIKEEERISQLESVGVKTRTGFKSSQSVIQSVQNPTNNNTQPTNQPSQIFNSSSPKESLNVVQQSNKSTNRLKKGVAAIVVASVGVPTGLIGFLTLLN